ncbi:MAG: FtsW/RodA/SpoVE family cell cycle protein [Planctomycetota bacterium]
MNPILHRLRELGRPHAGWYTVFAAGMLLTLGVSAIQTVRPAFAHAQLYFALPMGLLAFCIGLLLHPRQIGALAWPLYGFSLGLLVFLILPFVPESIVPTINSTKAWIDLGVINFQPSEMAKVAFVLAVAWRLRLGEAQRTLRGLLLPFALACVPIVLILKEPDLGQALVFIPTLLAMLVAAGAKLRHLAALAAIGVIGLALAVGVILLDPPHERELTGQHRVPKVFHVLASHQEKRIAALVWPDQYRQREAFQQITAGAMVGAGGLTGMGPRAAVILDQNRLPYPHNDMIFAVIVARWGLLGGLAVIGLYAVLVGSMLMIAARSRDPAPRLACVGFAAMIFTQAFITIGMTLGLLPIIGITLPLVSYGGSSLLMTMGLLGLVVNFASRKPQVMARPSFEFDPADAVFQ